MQQFNGECINHIPSTITSPPPHICMKLYVILCSVASKIVICMLRYWPNTLLNWHNKFCENVSKILFLLNPRLTKGRWLPPPSPPPPRIFPCCPQTKKKVTKTIEVIYTISYAVILKKKNWRDPLQVGQGEPSKMACTRGGCHAPENILSRHFENLSACYAAETYRNMLESQFPFFISQIPVKFRYFELLQQNFQFSPIFH